MYYFSSWQSWWVDIIITHHFTYVETNREGLQITQCHSACGHTGAYFEACNPSKFVAYYVREKYFQWPNSDRIQFESSSTSKKREESHCLLLCNSSFQTPLTLQRVIGLSKDKITKEPLEHRSWIYLIWN